MARNSRSASLSLFAFALFLSFFAPSAATAQTSNLQYQVANVMEDVRLLDERIRRLTIQMEDMRRENAQLQDRLREYETSESDRLARFVSAAQLNESIKQTVAALEARDEAMKREIVLEVTAKMTEFMKLVQKSVANTGSSGSKSRPGVKMHFDPTGIPENGIPYVVKSGDTLSSIAAKQKSRTEWIQNANKISDPSLLQVGQTLFVPQK